MNEAKGANGTKTEPRVGEKNATGDARRKEWICTLIL